MYWEKKFGISKSKGKFVIFAQKWTLGEILTLVSKVRKVSIIFETMHLSEILKEASKIYPNFKYGPCA